MSNNNKLPTTAVVCSIGAAVIATLSAYWIATSTQKSKKSATDINLLLDRLEEMQTRLDGIEKDKSNSNNNKSNINSKNKPKKQQSMKQLIKQAETIDSNANVVPPPLSDEEDDSVYAENMNKKPPQTIITKLKEDRASKFLQLPVKRRASMATSVSHHSTSGGVVNTQVESTSDNTTYNLRAPIPIVLISDPGQDLDDEMMFIMARHLVSLGLISLHGVIANLSPSFARARLTRGTLDLLGLHRVPVGIGTDGGDVMGKHSSDQFEETASSYIIHEDGEAARGLESGHRLLQRLYDAADDIEYVDVFEEVDEEGEDEFEEENDGEDGASINGEKNRKKQQPNLIPKKVVKGGLTIVITSSMKDIAIFVRDNPDLFASKTREVVVMGGCKPVPITESKTQDANSVSSDKCDSAANVWTGLSKMECEPDSAHNNTFDTDASAFFYGQCQKMNITLTVVSRYAAYAAKMPRSVYDDLALTGSSIGWRLRNSQRASIDQLWQRACSSDPAVRKGLPPRCDRKWFINTFCGGDDDPSRCCTDTAWDLVTGFMQYDTIALLAAIPAVREVYFDPFVMPPLQAVVRREDSGMSGDLGWSQQAEKNLDISEVTREEDETVNAGETNGTERRRSSMTGYESSKQSNGVNGKPSRRASCPGPRAIQRAIERAKEDNKLVETPFETPGSNIPEAFDRGTRNLIGISDKEHNLKDPNLLVNLLKTGYREGILCNHHTQPHIILHLQLRWDNLADTLLTCLMLRSLWDMRLASVLGVIVSIYPSDSNQSRRAPHGVDLDSEEGPDEGRVDGNAEKPTPDDQSSSTLAALAETIRETLSSIGLAHVKFVVVSGKDMDEHKKLSSQAFCELYESSPPIGVTLVLTATFTSVWPFAESHPELFRNKTVRVVHTGGSLIWPARWGWAALPSDKEDSNDDSPKGELTDEKILVPDPAAQNHRLDMKSAERFYKRAQALSVPMVILSRHVAKECCIPRNFFDVLGSHGGDVGKRIYDNERKSLLNLWKCSCAPAGSTARGNLPERCDKNWFADNFCAGIQASSEEEVWKSVEAVNLYSPIALLAALPGETLKSYFQTMPFPVRSATHHVIGLTEEVPPQNVINPSELRSLVVQSLLSASLANESAFRQETLPMVPIRMDHEQRRRGSGLLMKEMQNSVISTISFSGTDGLNYEDDMWTFSEAARRELFSRTVAATSKNAVFPKVEKRRKFIVDKSEYTYGFIPPQSQSDEE